jgi:predicted flap endonuclease-1-like 5' DNA nuclease
MNSLHKYISQLQTPEFLGIFVLMLSTFLIGYLFGLYLEKTKKRALINRLKKEVNTLRSPKKIKNISVIYDEIKPKNNTSLKQHVASSQKETTSQNNKQTIAAKARSEYVNYSHNRPLLDFESIGNGDKYNADSLTQINGIGPYIEQRLNEIGIYNYSQISRLQLKDITVITHLIDFFPGRIERDNWVYQAQELTLTQ